MGRAWGNFEELKKAWIAMKRLFEETGILKAILVRAQKESRTAREKVSYLFR